MTLFRKIAYIFLCVFVLLLIVALLLPRKVRCTASHESKVPANYLYNIANNMSLVKSYNAWFVEDTTIKMTLSTINEGPGASYTWDSPKNKGSFKIKQVVPNQSIEAEMAFGKGKDMASFVQKFSTKDGKSIVSWELENNISWPFNIMGPFMKSTMKKYFKRSLEKMDQIATARYSDSNYRGFKINPTTLPEYKFITSRSEVSFNEMDAFFSQNIAAIYKKIQDEGLTATAQPFGLFFKWDAANSKTDMAVGVPVTILKDIKDLSSLSIPSKDGFVINHYGDRSQTANAHTAMDEYLKDRNLIQDVPVMEEYVTDPLVEKDPKKWLTKVIYFKK